MEVLARALQHTLKSDYNQSLSEGPLGALGAQQLPRPYTHLARHVWQGNAPASCLGHAKPGQSHLHESWGMLKGATPPRKADAVLSRVAAQNIHTPAGRHSLHQASEPGA